jgi:hypothetical protein
MTVTPIMGYCSEPKRCSHSVGAAAGAYHKSIRIPTHQKNPPGFADWRVLGLPRVVAQLQSEEAQRGPLVRCRGVQADALRAAGLVYLRKLDKLVSSIRNSSPSDRPSKSGTCRHPRALPLGGNSERRSSRCCYRLMMFFKDAPAAELGPCPLDP